jgi:hypothetical protein
VKAPTETWRVDVPFWTEEEGQSDLVASWTIRIVDGAAAAIDLDSIRVM